MIQQTFRFQLKFSPLLEKNFPSFQINLRETGSEKIPFLSVGVTRFVLMFKRASNICLLPQRSYKMVAVRQVETPLFGGFGRQRGRAFGALAQQLGRTAIQFFRKYVVPPARLVGAHLLE